MPTKVGKAAFVLLLTLSVCAAETLVPRGAAFRVTNGTDVAEANVVRMMYGTLGVGKTGAGAYTLPRGQVDAPNPLVVNAVEGAVSLTDAGALPAPTEPTALLNMASFWLDASVNVQSNADDQVIWWYDRRETRTGDTWGTAYTRAKTDPSPKNANNEVYTPVMPTVETPAGQSLPMVYFGGFTTGTGMNLYETNSTTALSYASIYHVYLVANFQKTYGFPIGAGGSLMLHPSGFASGTGLSTTYNSGDSSPNSTAGEFLVNGARLNPMYTNVKKGLQLIEIHAPYHATMGAFGRIFIDRAIAGRWGGDYIGEVLVYNGAKKKLNEAERLQISRHLMHKWGITPVQGAASVTLGERAAAQVAESLPVTVSGRGTLVRAGTESAHYAPTGRKPMAGAKVRLATGSMKADARELTLALKAGDTLASTTDAFGVHTVTAAQDADAAAAGRAAISGVTESIRLGHLDAGVTNLTVGAKEVVLGDAATGGARLVAEIGTATIANPSFESAFSANDWVWVSKNGSSGIKTLNAESDLMDWRIAGGGDAPANFKANYRMAGFMPTDGKNVLILKDVNKFYGHVNVSKEGDYILSFDGTGRYLYANMQLILSLVDAAEHTNTFACCTLAMGTGFRPYRFPLHRIKAGAYKLVVDALNGLASNSYDSHALLDNFRMETVLDGLTSLGGVPVPNGSFENTRITSSSRTVSTFSTNQLACAGWTLTSPGAPIEGALAPASRLMTGNFLPDEHNFGEWQLRFHGGTGRATSDAFTLPAGRWKLRCKAAKWSFDGARWNNTSDRTYNPKVGVRAFVNGIEVFNETSAELATTAYDLTPVLFKNELVVSATDQIILEMRQAVTSGGFMNLDDLEFVPADTWGATTELVKDGTFAGGVVNWTVGGPGNVWEKSLNGGYEIHYGGQQCDDKYAVCIVNAGSVSQSLTFPAAGTYRLSFWARSRVDYYGGTNSPNSHSYGGNKVRALLIDGETTNTLVVTPPIYSTNFNQTVALFTVPSAGARTLCLEGVNNPKASPAVWTGGNKNDCNVMLDAVSVTVATEDVAPNLPEYLQLDLTDAGGKLRLDFVGTNEIARLRIGGRGVCGVVDATTYPDLVSGPGALFIRPNGTILIFR